MFWLKILIWHASISHRYVLSCSYLVLSVAVVKTVVLYTEGNFYLCFAGVTYFLFALLDIDIDYTNESVVVLVAVAAAAAAVNVTTHHHYKHLFHQPE